MEIEHNGKNLIVRPWTLKDWNRMVKMMMERSETLPDIDCSANVVWLLDLESQDARDAIRAQFEEHLFATRDPRVARFSVLRFYFEFREVVDDNMAPEEIEEITSALDADFRYFLELPPVPEDLQDPEVVRWELCQTWLARHWARLVKLSDRLVQLSDGDGRALDLELARLLWAGVARPSMPRGQAFAEPGAFECGWLGPFGGARVVEPEDREWLRLAASRIKKVIDLGEQPRPFYLGVLADCQADTGDYLPAARIWEEHGAEIVRDGMADFAEFMQKAGQTLPPKGFDGFRLAERYLFVANCLDKANGHGDREKAIDGLERFLVDHPDSPQVHHRLAELLAKENRYEDAIAHVARERELTQDADTWKDPFADIAWHSAYLKSTASKESYISSSGAGVQKKQLERAIHAHWPTFAFLAPECQEKWISGCFWLFAEHDPADWSERERANYAATDLAVAVEWQLRLSLFKPFKDADGAGLVSKAKGNQEDRLYAWRLYLTSDFQPNLGAMQTILLMANGTQIPLLKPFEDWLNKVKGGEWKQLYDRRWDTIAEARNRNLHSAPIEFAEAPALLKSCREFLELLFRAPASGPVSKPSPGRPR